MSLARTNLRLFQIYYKILIYICLILIAVPALGQTNTSNYNISWIHNGNNIVEFVLKMGYTSAANGGLYADGRWVFPVGELNQVDGRWVKGSLEITLTQPVAYFVIFAKDSTQGSGYSNEVKIDLTPPERPIEPTDLVITISMAIE